MNPINQSSASIIILFALAILACATLRASGKSKPARFPHLTGWQKILGALAIVIALLIILNPEFLALGLLGDTAFFDMLVIGLSLQMHITITKTLRTIASLITTTTRRLGIPSPGLRYLIAISTVMLGTIIETCHKTFHRILS